MPIPFFRLWRIMEPLRIYRIDDKYIRFMKSRDYRVQDNKNRRRPYVGIVLYVGDFRYFVPMESRSFCAGRRHTSTGAKPMC